MIITEYIIHAENEEDAKDQLLDGAWEKEEIVDYANEEVLKVEDIALEVD
tara:strand:- start:665 stop:814 length:150 start_codon:yes stop_codon:yes gene_type:complete